MISRLEVPNLEIQKAQIRAAEKRELKQLDVAEKHGLKQLDVGVVGRFIGSKEHASLNIAAVICFFFYIAFMTILLIPSEMLVGKSEILAIVAGIILPIMGFLFGRGSSS